MNRVWLLAALLAGAPLAGLAQDFEREARWRAEIVPNIVVGDAVDLHTGDGRSFLGLYIATPGAKTALVILHGVAVHPDHGLIGTLRMTLADSGFTTLSLQMPVLAADTPPESYARVFPLAAERISAAAKWLAERGYRDLVIVSHSLGSRMANAYFDGTGKPAYRRWVALGLADEFSQGFAENKPVPVLDVQGDTDLPAVLKNGPARKRVAESIPGGRQLTIVGADHFYAGRQAELTAAIAAFAPG